MTRKDYREIARAINDSTLPGPDNTLYKPKLIGELVEILRRDNPRFDEGKFRAACGLPIGGKYV
jgi:hypothetical protein